MVKPIYDKVLGVVRDDKFTEYLYSDGFGSYDFNFDLFSYNIIYLGQEDVDGSWRMVNLGGSYIIQNRQSGVWVSKSFLDVDGNLEVVGGVSSYGCRDNLRYSFMLGN